MKPQYMVYKTLEIHNILWFAVDNILPSEAFMVSNSTTGTFMKKNVPAKSFADKEKFSFAMPLHLRKFFRQIRSLKRASIFYPFLLPFCKRLWYNIFKKVKKFFRHLLTKNILRAKIDLIK